MALILICMRIIDIKMNETYTKTMQQKTFSLPRLKEEYKPSSPSPRKRNKDIHKTRWSMAPKCLMEGHEGRDVLYVCIDPQCDQLTRLVCEACFFKGHQKHNEQFLAIDEIKAGSIQRLRYWPFEQKYRKMFEFITAHESHVSNLIQDVNATFHGMAARIIGSIDKIRLDLLKKIDNFYLKETRKKHFCTKVKDELQRCFELKQIREVVRELFSKEIKHEVFLAQMDQLLNRKQALRNRELLQDYFQNAEKGTDMIFDQMRFLKKENWIIQQIQEQKVTLREAAVEVEEIDVGIERILAQTLAYMDRQAEGHYPLTFQKRILEDESEYTGFIEKGSRAMFGRRRYKNGFVYYGEWKLNSKNGWGILQNKATGYRYAGVWKEDKKNGYGRQQTLTTIYEGNFLGDKKDGFGIFTEDGVRFEVTWKADKKHGAGKKIQKNGIQCQIYYINGIEATGPSKSSKITQAFNLKELTKRFGTKSFAQKTRSN